MLASQIKAIFVFDGTRLKKGRWIRQTESWDEKVFKILIKMFGFEVSGPPPTQYRRVESDAHQVWNAPSNAESELAQMNQTGVVDAIMTVGPCLCIDIQS